MSEMNKQQWQNRIVGYGVKPADQFLAHPDNPRRHPQKQRDAVKASLDTLGFIAPVLENVRTGYLIDGHERIMQALVNNNDVPYIQVDLSEDEEKLALASFDWITYMAEYDRDVLDNLLRDVNTDSAGMQALLTDLASRQGIIPPDNPFTEWVGMPEYNTDPLAYQSIHVHFKSQEDVDKFAQLINQKITDKTSSLWFPAQEKRSLQSQGYITDES